MKQTVLKGIVLSGFLILLSMSFSTSAKESLFSENETVNFTFESQSPGVDVTFKGHSFDPELVVIPKRDEQKTPSADEILAERYIDFFHTIKREYSANNKNNYLSVWNPAEREAIGNNLTPQELAQISNIFTNMESAKLAKAVKYGDFTLLYVLFTFSGGLEFMEAYPLLDQPNQSLYLSNMLIDDPFFNYISQVLDSRLTQ